jgi:mRNA interferase RelE/StbE
LLKVEWTEKAIDDLAKLDRLITRRIIKKVTWFARNFENITPEPLSGSLKGMFKLRVGDWRVVYKVEGEPALIYFVGHRREIYGSR